MLPDRVSNPGPLTYESGALPIALRGPATFRVGVQRLVLTLIITCLTLIYRGQSMRKCLLFSIAPKSHRGLCIIFLENKNGALMSCTYF